MKKLSLFLMIAVLVGCSNGPKEADLVGTWHAISPEFPGSPALVLVLQSGNRWEMHSFAGTMYGDWSVSGKTLTLKMTGMDDGYSKSKDDPGWRAGTKPIELPILSDTEIDWPSNGEFPMEMTLKKQ